MRASISRYSLPLLLGFLALALAGPIRAFQDGITHSPMPSSLDATRYELVMAGQGFRDGVATDLNSNGPSTEQVRQSSPCFPHNSSSMVYITALGADLL
jgi:hypothetical protein